MNDKDYGQGHGIRVFGRLRSTRRAGGRRSNARGQNCLCRVENDLPMPKWWTEVEAANLFRGRGPMGVNPTKSDQMGVNGSKSD